MCEIFVWFYVILSDKMELINCMAMSACDYSNRNLLVIFNNYSTMVMLWIKYHWQKLSRKSGQTIKINIGKMEKL